MGIPGDKSLLKKLTLNVSGKETLQDDSPGDKDEEQEAPTGDLVQVVNGAPRVILFSSMHSKQVKLGKMTLRNMERNIVKRYRQMEKRLRKVQQLLPQEVLNLEQQIEKE